MGAHIKRTRKAVSTSKWVEMSFFIIIVSSLELHYSQLAANLTRNIFFWVLVTIAHSIFLESTHNKLQWKQNKKLVKKVNDACLQKRTTLVSLHLNV